MFKPFSFFIGLRYSLTRKRNLFLSFVSLISMLGVSLGVLILIVALSVINGSIGTLRSEVLKSVPHVTVSAPSLEQNWQDVRATALAAPEVLAAAPFMEGEATLRHQGETTFLRLRGIDPTLEAAVIENGNRFYGELLERLANTPDGIIIGTQLAGQLGIFSSTEVSVLGLGSLLNRELSNSLGFEVLGFADFGLYGNNNVALVNLEAADTLFAQDPGVELQLRLRVDDILRAGQIAEAALQSLAGVDIVPWNEVQASLFNALNMEKILTSFMLLMIVIIGAVNIISTLVMVVSDKGADIAILRTMGASRGVIMAIFMVQGLIAGIIGIIVGGIGGVILALSITDISLLLERLLNSLFSGANIYLISHLQTRIAFSEVMFVCFAALIICFVATLYPAYRASRVQPAEFLRYE
ncbi:MAG: FtsX-like permease family protein [Proteobacteria bacterium]|nr:FtsX-like permease family protein [Pseudomonadota bacterium]MDA0927438.1 FtsX-like permease family protein [Pseudomonadota bacterium]